MAVEINTQPGDCLLRPGNKCQIKDCSVSGLALEPSEEIRKAGAYHLLNNFRQGECAIIAKELRASMIQLR